MTALVVSLYLLVGLVCGLYCLRLIAKEEGSLDDPDIAVALLTLFFWPLGMPIVIYMFSDVGNFLDYRWDKFTDWLAKVVTTDFGKGKN